MVEIFVGFHWKAFIASLVEMTVSNSSFAPLPTRDVSDCETLHKAGKILIAYWTLVSICQDRQIFGFESNAGSLDTLGRHRHASKRHCQSAANLRAAANGSPSRHGEPSGCRYGIRMHPKDKRPGSRTQISEMTQKGVTCVSWACHDFVRSVAHTERNRPERRRPDALLAALRLQRRRQRLRSAE